MKRRRTGLGNRQETWGTVGEPKPNINGEGGGCGKRLRIGENGCSRHGRFHHTTDALCGSPPVSGQPLTRMAHVAYEGIQRARNSCPTARITFQANLHLFAVVVATLPQPLRKRSRLFWAALKRTMSPQFPPMPFTSIPSTVRRHRDPRRPALRRASLTLRPEVVF